ncbi:MAG: hypothetical protein II394_01650, partial [Bacteroidales bacterium]|nr:hypothetical protein [Bacteroidales bacterium]
MDGFFVLLQGVEACVWDNRHFGWSCAITEMYMIIRINIPLQPRGLLLFCWQKSKQKTMSAVSALLKIGYTSLKIRN